MKTLRPLFFFVGLLLVVGMACSVLGSPSTPAPQPPTEAPIQVQPTQPPAPTDTAAPVATQPPVATDTSAPPPTVSKFFTEEFDSDPGSAWVIDILGPGAEANKDAAKSEFTNGRMRIELPKNDLYFYYTYTGETYDDVRVDLKADNRGVNSNNVSLVCRVSKDGWYEWSVGNDGSWYLYAVTDKYYTIANGGTTYLKQGKVENEYGFSCKGKTLSMFINGQEVKQSPITDNNYGLRSGTVGFNVSSLNVTPVIVEVEWFKVSQP